MLLVHHWCRLEIQPLLDRVLTARLRINRSSGRIVLMRNIELFNTKGGLVTETHGVYGKVLKFLNYNPNKGFLNSIAEFIIQTTESITGVDFVDNRALWFGDFHYMIMEGYLEMQRENIDYLNDEEKQLCFAQAFEIHQDIINSQYSFYEIAALLEYQLLDLYKPFLRRTSVIEYKARVITSIIVHHVKRTVEGFPKDKVLGKAMQWKHGQLRIKDQLEYPILGFFHKNSLWHFDLKTLLSMPTEMLSLYFRKSKVSEVQALLEDWSHDSSAFDLFEKSLINMRYVLKEQMSEEYANTVFYQVHNSLITAIICLEKKDIQPDADRRAMKHLMSSEVLRNLYMKSIPWYRRLTHNSRMRNMGQLLTAYLFESIIVSQRYTIEQLEITWNPYFLSIYENVSHHSLEVPPDSLTPSSVKLRLTTGEQENDKTLAGEIENSGQIQELEKGFDQAVEKLESMKKEIASYQFDFGKAISYPAFNDVTVPEVTAMYKQLSKTENLLMKVSNDKSKTLLHEFIESVDVLAIDFKVAQRRAESLAHDQYSEEERKYFILAENLFRQAKDEGNTQKMRQNYYVKLQEVLERLNKSTEVIPYEIVQEIEETARKQLTS